LLYKLTRLRYLREPNYHVKRPVKIAQVKQLIKQLERVMPQGLFLDRVKRRDWPPEYRSCFSGDLTQLVQSSPHSDRSVQTARDFGWRRDIDLLKEDIIARSHFNSDPSTARPFGLALEQCGACPSGLGAPFVPRSSGLSPQ